MKKIYNVIAYQTNVYETQVEANSKEEAMDIARSWNITHSAWKHIPDDFIFDVADAWEMDEEEE